MCLFVIILRGRVFFEGICFKVGLKEHQSKATRGAYSSDRVLEQDSSVSGKRPSFLPHQPRNLDLLAGLESVGRVRTKPRNSATKSLFCKQMQMGGRL